MKKERQSELISKGYKIIVALVSKASGDGMTLKSYFQSPATCRVHKVYWRHAQEHLSEEQKLLIKGYERAKNLSFRDRVELNGQSQKGTIDKLGAKILEVKSAIILEKYLEA